MLNVLEKISSTHMGQIVPVSLVVATHNVQSVELCKESLRELKIPHSRVDLVVFGQLLGMSDSIMIDLSNDGFQAYKYIPYGPLEKVIPYLVRRLQENQQILEHLSTKSLFYSLFRN